MTVLVLLAALSAQPRLVTVGGSVTETVFALNRGASIVGVDSSSETVPQAHALPQVGYQGAFSVEGVLSLRPTLVILGQNAGPPASIAALESSGVSTLKIDEPHTLEGAKLKIQKIAAALEAAVAGEQLIAQLNQTLNQVKKPGRSPRVLFIYARGSGAMSVAGQKTAAASAIQLAGGVVPFNFEGYRALTAEGLLVAKPEIIVLTKMGLQACGGVAAVLALPAVADTPAGKRGRVVAVDDLALLGFGHRLGEGVLALSKAFAQP